MELQAYFNKLQPGLSPKTIKLIHGTLRAALNQGIAWEMLSKNPAVGVKLRRKRAVKPTVLLLLYQIRQMLETLPKPTRSPVTLIVFGSMRPGEVFAIQNQLRDSPALTALGCFQVVDTGATAFNTGLSRTHLSANQRLHLVPHARVAFNFGVCL
jgi:hypothetical protein